MDKFVVRKRPATENENEQCREKTKLPQEKKRKAATKFNSSHSSMFPFMKPSQKGETFAFCAVCNVNISVASGGRDDIKKHVEGQKHLSAVRESSTPIQKVSSYFSKSEDLSVIKAEVLWTQFIMDRNLPLRVSDGFGTLLKQMCPDSEIAKKFSCGKTKTRAIAGCLGDHVTAELVTKMQSYPFSLCTDGSNDHCNKLYPIVITIYNEDFGKVTTELLSIPDLKECSTAANILELIIKELDRFKVPLRNCSAFMSDNAAVMVGAKGGVSTLLKKAQPDMISLGCGCHLINLAVKKATSALPLKIDELLTDVYYYFHHSEKRVLEFSKVQLLYNEETKHILKHCPTRWLSLTQALQRMVELWQPLLEYLKNVKAEEDEVAKKRENRKKAIKDKTQDISEKIVDSMFNSKSNTTASTSTTSCKEVQPTNLSRLERLLESLKSKKSLVYSAFLLWVMPIFDKFNKCLQKEEPQIQILNELYLSLYRDIMSKFVNHKVVSAKTDIMRIDFENENNHIKDLYIGECAMKLLSNMKTKSKCDILSNIKHFYISCLNYIKDNFPVNSDVLLHAEFTRFDKRLDCSFEDVEFFSSKLPLKCTQDTLRQEFDHYRINELPKAVESEPRCDRQWHLLLIHKSIDGSFPYENLARLALNVLSIPHSNAAAERIFSVVRKNRNECRSLMSNDTLNTLLVNKVRQSFSSSRPIQLTEQLLRKCKRSTMESLHPTEQH